MVRLVIRVVIALFVVASLGACQTGGGKKSVETLNTTIKNYGQFIRWRAYDEATGFIKNRNDEAVNKDTSSLAEIRVTKYQIATVNIDQENNEAQVTAEITYYHERVNNVKTITDQQVWWQDEESGRWFLEGQLPSLTP